MQIKTLYRITRENGGTTVTPNKPTDTLYTETYRLIADEGMVLTDGVNTYGCIDTDDASKFTEIKDETNVNGNENVSDGMISGDEFLAMVKEVL
jgi:hypothetical protein